MKLIERLERHPRVDSVSDERESGNGFWIYAAKGFWNPRLGTHGWHEDTMQQTYKAFVTQVEICTCRDCE